MRLTQHQIRSLSQGIVDGLEKRRLVRFMVPEEEAVSLLEKAVTEDLRLEDKLNDEVKEILKTYEREIEQGKADYKTMFDLVKKKLVRERGIIL